jgi:hypothetical protein
MVDKVGVMISEQKLEELFGDYIRDVRRYGDSSVTCFPIIDGYVQPNVMMLLKLEVKRVVDVELENLVVGLDIRCKVENKSGVVSAIGDDSKCNRLFNEIESSRIRFPVQLSDQVIVGESINLGGVDYVRRR